MKYQGRIHVVGDHIDTDQIIPARFLGSLDPKVLAEGCFFNLIPQFATKVTSGDILVAGDNLGCGSSREHAPIAIKAAGISCVVARSFSRIFYRSAINIGLPAIVCPEAVAFARQGAEMSVDFDRGVVESDGKSAAFAPFGPSILAIIAAGGLVPFMQQRLAREGAAA
jgi:3-isopropylmalate/(R)-2-methylmalate dehydratase small subunit